MSSWYFKPNEFSNRSDNCVLPKFPHAASYRSLRWIIKNFQLELKIRRKKFFLISSRQFRLIVIAIIIGLLEVELWIELCSTDSVVEGEVEAELDGSYVRG